MLLRSGRYILFVGLHSVFHPHDFLLTSADGVLKLDVVSRFSGMVLVLVNLPEVLVVIPRAVPTSVVILSVPRGEIFSLPLVSRLHCTVKSAVPLPGCNIVDIYVGDFVHCCGDCCDNEFTAIVSSVSHYFRLSGHLVDFDCMFHGVLRVLIEESTFTILYDSLSAVYSFSAQMG